MIPSPADRIAQVGIRMLAAFTIAALATFGGAEAVNGSTARATAQTNPASQSCADGVAVVVDFTDIGGKVETGCAAQAPATGRAALLAAGFTAVDSQPGLICAINSMPNPCPETFQGSFWSYWHSTATSEWVSYQVGADASAPKPGDIEGWRYDNGSTPPGIAPADVAGALPTPTPSATSDPSASPSDSSGSANSVGGEQDAIAQDRAAQNLVLTITGIGFLALVIIVILVFVLRARRRGPGARD
ncbi:MAG: hypothetical protein ABI238_08015 [Terrimesophilobacter sp.]